MRGEVAWGLPDAKDMPVLLRATIAAPSGRRLIVNDFSGVEARATGWAAGDEPTLDVFRSGADPYKAAAVDIYGVAYDDVTKAQRQIGKVAVLALGYQGGEGAFSKMASGYGIDVSELDVQAIVDAWRAAHRSTVSFWYACQRAFVAACTDGRSTHVGPFEFCPGTDGSVAAFLPSGRPLVYRDAEAHQLSSSASGRPRWSCTHYGQIKPGLWGTVHTYGGKLVENLIQATCRDLMAHAMLECERVGLPVVLTVHDEIISEVTECEARDAYDEHRRIMSTPPDWALEFPLTADGFYGRRYRK
jgi:DNA polymerase